MSLIHIAITGNKCYNLGVIVTRRLQHNAASGNFYGGIYASRVAEKLNVSPWPNDPILPIQYLDFEAMKHHRFLKGTTTNYTYNLRFNKDPVVPVTLPATALFDFHSRGRYYVLESEAYEYNAEVEAARRAAESAPRFSMSHRPDYYSYGW